MPSKDQKRPRSVGSQSGWVTVAVALLCSFVEDWIDDPYYNNVQWTLEGYVDNGHAHDLRYLDFTALQTYDECATPGGGTAYITGGGKADFNDCSFQKTKADNGNGGAISVHSDFNLDPNTTTSLTISHSRFQDMATDFYGPWLYSSLSDVKVSAP